MKIFLLILSFVLMFSLNAVFIKTGEKKIEPYYPIFEIDRTANIERYNLGYIDTVEILSNKIIIIEQLGLNIGTNITDFEIGTFNRGVDTIRINNKLYIEKNPFPDVYYFENSKKNKEKVKEFPPIKPQNYGYIDGEPHISFHKNGMLSSICLYNNFDGTVKAFFSEKGRIIAKGAFKDNKRNGLWMFYDKKGKLEKKIYVTAPQLPHKKTN